MDACHRLKGMEVRFAVVAGALLLGASLGSGCVAGHEAPGVDRPGAAPEGGVVAVDGGSPGVPDPTTDTGAPLPAPDAGVPAVRPFCASAAFSPDSPVLVWRTEDGLAFLHSDGRRSHTVFESSDGSAGPPDSFTAMSGFTLADRVVGSAGLGPRESWLVDPTGDIVWHEVTDRRLQLVYAGEDGVVLSGSLGHWWLNTEGSVRSQVADIAALGGPDENGVLPVRWERPGGTVWGFLSPDGERTPLSHAPRNGQVSLVDGSLQYLTEEGEDLLLLRQRGDDLTELSRVRPQTQAHLLGGPDGWWLLVVDDVPHAVLGPQDETARLLPAVRPSPSGGWGQSAHWFVASDEHGLPVWRVDGRSATVQDLRGLDLQGLRALDSHYCNPPALVDSDGRLLVGLRDDRRAGIFSEPAAEGEDWKLRGAALWEVGMVNAWLLGDLLRIEATGLDEPSFCPPVESSWGAPPEGALVGTSQQLAHAQQPPFTLDGHADVHPSGTCVLYQRADGETRLVEPSSGHAWPTELGDYARWAQ